ncbi:hypothetical protein Pst134EA_024088 [Puccinia striiformis f. sp. tritici]|uniref:hypothetical protein n=1 Tax=Puccinia striiformis f. sp. tritici TaxID=168172 RepID=UPI002007352B|nr:hypothetical protein Pst134EA_024088 [Puccinia striiformis f. sp. tritici]KAH9453203.1 hypothetical protein Pst134EA_024088 [Puccinia striiformis f. sp. tritici]
MISCRVILIVAISLLNAGESLQQAGKPAPLDIKCSNKKQLLPADCIKAYQQIIYNGDSTTDSNAGKIEKAFGSCTTVIENPRYLRVPKAIIEDAFNQLGAKCKGLTGNVVLPNYDGVRLLARHHSRRFARYEDSHPLLQPLCRAPPPKDVIPSECKAAYEAFPTNAQGQLMSIDKHQQSNMMISTVKGCVVTIGTTDSSRVWVSKSEAAIAFQKLMDGCGTQGGYIITKGALGKNGKLALQANGRG